MKKFNFKTKLFALAVLAVGATAAVPAVIPSTVMAAEPTVTQNTNGWYEIVRNINIYYVNDDGSTTFGGTAPYVGKVSNRNMVFTFPEIRVVDLFGGNLGYWKPDKETIPSVTATYDDQPAEVDIYLRKDIRSYTEESKTIKRTVKYFYVGSDGKKTSAGEYMDGVTFKRSGYIDAQGNKVMYDWSGEHTLKEIPVADKAGYTPNMTKVPSRTVTPMDSDFTVEVIYSQIPTRTENREFVRKINYKYKNTDQAFKTITQKITLSREVYTDGNGKIVVVRDWNEGEFKAHNVENVDGYTADKETVPSAKITVGGTPSDVNVYFTKNAQDSDTNTPSNGNTGNTGNTGASEGGSNAYEPVTETKTVKRTIKFVKKYTNGTTSDYGYKTQTATFSRTGYIDKNGKKIMPDWPQQTWAAVKVPVVAGFAAEKTVVPAATFTPDNAPGDEIVYLNQLSTRTETKTIKRTINLIGKKADGQTVSLGTATQSITLNREVYTDTDGSVKVYRDWNTGTLSAFSVPDRGGYTRQQSTVPSVKVTAKSDDISVDVFYLSNDIPSNNFTGFIKYNNIWYYYKNGSVDISFTGMAKASDRTWYYFTNGKTDLGYTGMAKSPKNGQWYYMKDGVLDRTYTGMAKSPKNGQWYYMKKGILDRAYTGLAVSSLSGKTYYIINGFLDRSFSGTVIFNGKNYKVARGLVV